MRARQAKTQVETGEVSEPGAGHRQLAAKKDGHGWATGNPAVVQTPIQPDIRLGFCMVEAGWKHEENMQTSFPAEASLPPSHWTPLTAGGGFGHGKMEAKSWATGWRSVRQRLPAATLGLVCVGLVQDFCVRGSWTREEVRFARSCQWMRDCLGDCLVPTLALSLVFGCLDMGADL